MPGLPLSGVWGKPETLTVANPGAGVLLSVPVPVAEQWWVYSVSFLFTASGVAANRLLRLEVDSAGVLVNSSTKSTANHTAGLAIRYFFQVGMADFATFSDARYFRQLPPLMLPPSVTITIQVDNLDPGDAFTNARVVLHRSYL